MTRLVAMTFWGREKFLEKPAAHDEHGAHSHGSHVPHESPPSMWVPLAVLAVLATIGGFVGISPAFTGGHHVGGRLNIVNFLQPIIWNSVTGEFGTGHGATAEEAHAPATEPTHAQTGETRVFVPVPSERAHDTGGFNLAHAVTNALGSHTLAEWVFIVISLFAAGVGIGLGYLFYVRDPRLPERWATRLGPLYRASYNKYWVDEFYGLLVTRRTMDLARLVFTIDSKVIDGLVNGSAWLTRLSSRVTGGADKYVVDGLVNSIAAFIIRLMSPLFRAAQTGFTQNYALVMVLGLVVAVALLFGGDIVRQLRIMVGLS
jgi:NADH-quinone oxidoreductase subunit L